MKINPKKQISKKYKTSIGYLEGTISIILNTLLFGLKYWVGIKTFSIAIIADAWHTLSDSLTSLVVIIGFKVSSKPADKKHPFGHGRAEIISSVIIGTMLAIVGFNFLIASIQRFINQQSASYGNLAIIVFIK
jgi:cation diffusion facilitator family transporter